MRFEYLPNTSQNFLGFSDLVIRVWNRIECLAKKQPNESNLLSIETLEPYVQVAVFLVDRSCETVIRLWV